MSVWQTCSQLISIITIFPWVGCGSLCFSMSSLSGMSCLKTEHPSPVLSWESRGCGVAPVKDQKSDCTADSWGGPGLRMQMQKSSWVGRLGQWAEGGFGVCCIAIPGTGGWNRQIRAPAQPVSGQGLGKSAMLALASPWDSSAGNHTSYWVTWGPGTHDMAQAARPSWGLAWEPAFCHFCHIPLVKTGPGPSTDLRGRGYPKTWILGGLVIGVISSPSHPCSHLFPSLQPIWRAQSRDWVMFDEGGMGVQITSATCLCVFGSWHGKWQLSLPRAVPLPCPHLPPSLSIPSPCSQPGGGGGCRGEEGALGHRQAWSWNLPLPLIPRQSLNLTLQVYPEGKDPENIFSQRHSLGKSARRRKEGWKQRLWSPWRMSWWVSS